MHQETDLPDTGDPGILPARRQKRSDMIAGRIRDLISRHGLGPGDRIPQQWLADQELKASKGTVREAMKALETQGLIKSRTGPGGGAFVTALSGEQAMGLLSNLFLFNQPSFADIYSIRKLLEPELARSLAGKLDQKTLGELQAMIALYESAPSNAGEEFSQFLRQLDFATALAGNGANLLLSFVLVFLHRLLREASVCRDPDATPQGLQEAGTGFQVRLLRAMKAGDDSATADVMREYMEAEEHYMLSRAMTRQKRSV
ncbi:GntR family transcriptional regulator [Aquamicrobium sp. LC103]|uniref:FadR/GntR family transcriptional regulator n=1 Tax=Aquamicrobium sp. LC103 TaxID=1120658 RepID=UPI00063EB6C0|nr:GntR family transcriptional regulator [Aquamicrobium sp. LC103]TKT76286.1 GntR family transcriptional regulator [Aquamicrobium sp. LC103]